MAVADLLTQVTSCATAGAGTTPGKRPRPPDVPAGEVTDELSPNAIQLFNGYGTAERIYQTSSVVVHYVTTSVNAPPLNDDGDGIPDYVRRTAQAADRAIASFEDVGFRPIRGDTGGPNSLPDLYVSRLTPGYFGVALPSDRAEGGAFVVIANWLDPSPTRSLGSLCGTVAHELFHLVQFSYFAETADPDLPAWVLEGAAGGIEKVVFPEVDDLLWNVQARAWLASPDRSVTSSSYGAELFWNYVERAAPKLLPAFLAELARRPDAAPVGLLSRASADAGAPPPARLFHAFAVDVHASRPDRLAPTGRLAYGPARTIVTVPLALQDLRLPLPAGLGYRITVRVPARAGSGHATLADRLAPDVAGGWHRVVHPAPTRAGPDAVGWLLRSNPRLESPDLILTDPSTAGPSRYRVSVTRIEPRHWRFPASRVASERDRRRLRSRRAAEGGRPGVFTASSAVKAPCVPCRIRQGRAVPGRCRVRSRRDRT